LSEIIFSLKKSLSRFVEKGSCIAYAHILTGLPLRNENDDDDYQ